MTNQINRQFQNNFQTPEQLQVYLENTQISLPYTTDALSEFINIIVASGRKCGVPLDYHTVLKTMLGFAPMDPTGAQDPINAMNGDLLPLRYVAQAMKHLLLV